MDDKILEEKIQEIATYRKFKTIEEAEKNINLIESRIVIWFDTYEKLMWIKNRLNLKLYQKMPDYIEKEIIDILTKPNKEFICKNKK